MVSVSGNLRKAQGGGGGGDWEGVGFVFVS